jgi:hypothetical protein
MDKVQKYNSFNDDNFLNSSITGNKTAAITMETPFLAAAERGMLGPQQNPSKTDSFLRL